MGEADEIEVSRGARKVTAAAATIGDNNPPPDPFGAHEIAILDLIDLANGCLTGGAIDTDEKAAQVEELLDSIKDAAKALEATRKAEKAPWDAGAKAVQDIAVPLANKLETAKKVAQSALTPYRLAQQAARDAVAQAARDEAERLQQEALAAFQTSPVTDLEARLAADGLADAAKKAAATANRVDRQATGLRTSWHGTVTDAGAFLAWLKKHRANDLKAWLAEQAQREVYAGQRAIAGVLIEERKVAI
jgi:hypothetical protein